LLPEAPHRLRSAHRPTPPQIRSSRSPVVRRSWARRVATANAEIPHYSLSASLAIDAADDLRRVVAEDAPVRLTLTDITVLACARALRAVPAVNASWVDGTVVWRGAVHIGLAVALDNDGLAVPALRNADAVTLTELAELRAELVSRARLGTLLPVHLDGAKFSVSNLGMFGIDEFHAIVNPPESGILAIGRIEDRVVINGDGLSTRRMMCISL
jgi:pyruvate dehydrogenase E2 component (dihydrolipoamide acetyltransferase)